VSDTDQDTGARGVPQMMPSNDAERASVYTMAELAADTYAVVDRIRLDGPALITRHGRFVALISPVEDAGALHRALGRFDPALRLPDAEPSTGEVKR
jgi:antitoxin (DNA-binding transcriptional repressor) of toxin-antitoxin stability system